MRERARDKGRLADIIEYSNNVTMLIEGYTFDKFLADKRTYYSVMKNVEVVGEAAFMLTKAFKEAHPATPWNVVQGMRHVLVHDYATIDARELYNTAVNDMLPLRKQVETYLADTNWDEWESIPDEFEISEEWSNTRFLYQLFFRQYPGRNLKRWKGEKLKRLLPLNL